MTLDGLLERRRSVRRFRADALERTDIERLLEAAVSAPSASNKQPWRWLVVTNRERIEQLASAVREATRALQASIPEQSQVAFAAYGEYFTRFEHAPCVIVPICRGHAVLSQLVDDSLPRKLREAVLHMERHSAVVSTSLGLMNLLLKATDIGLGASAMTGPLVAAGALKELLGVPKSWSIVALVAVGHPDEDPKATTRKALQHVVRFID
ncbi:MAG: nitroreductase family protein [Polyangiaceae bacterium]|nr:nitroreductase family protein [Myxococcales bacterium]MCB9590706.1 nitroreductase family protein [Polyangiaceae bacterium]